MCSPQREGNDRKSSGLYVNTPEIGIESSETMSYNDHNHVCSNPEVTSGFSNNVGLSSDTGRRPRSALLRELEAIGSGLLRAGASLCGSMESVLGICTLVSPRPRKADGFGVQSDRRRIRIEVVNDRYTGKGRRGWTHEDDESQDWSYDQPDHNFSSALTVNSLSDGVFSAQIPMANIPFGDLIIRIRNYRLEIVLHKRHLVVGESVDDSHRVTRPSLVGSIDIPIYVDTSTLHFRLDTEHDVLSIEGAMKGYLDRKFSSSAGDIRSTSLLYQNRYRRPKSKDSRSKYLATDVRGSFDEVSKFKDIPTPHIPIGNGWINRFRSRAHTH